MWKFFFKPILTLFVGINLLLPLGSRRCKLVIDLIKISDWTFLFQSFSLISIEILRIISNISVKLQAIYAFKFRALKWLTFWELFAFCELWKGTRPYHCLWFLGVLNHLSQDFWYIQRKKYPTSDEPFPYQHFDKAHWKHTNH